MKYLLLTLSLMGGLLSFNSFASAFASVSASDKPTPQECSARSELKDTTMTHYWQAGTSYYAYYQGCEYVSFHATDAICIESSSGYFCNWKPTGKVESSDGTPDTKPDNPDSGSSGSGDDSSAGSSSGGSVSPTPVPEKPYPDNASAGQLRDLYFKCTYDLSKIPHADYSNYNPSVDIAYNNRVDACNSIYDKLSSLVGTGSVVGASDNNHNFITKDGVGNLYSCRRNSFTYEQWVATKPGSYPGELVGSQLVKPEKREIGFNCRIVDGKNHCDVHLNFNYNTYNGYGTSVCNGTYNMNKPADSGSGDSVPDSGTSGNSGSGDVTTDFNPNPGTGGGSGSGSTDSNDNGDVVAAINAFHADNNKNHRELMDDLNKKPADPDYTGMEGEFSSVVGGAMSGITDSVKSAWDAGKAAFGEGLSGIDSMLPDIKTSFDLPPGFEAASTGRCIPVVLDFDIKLVGIPDYHFHAVGTQVCLLYDKYIRPVLNFCMVILSFFVIHRLLIRSAEFLTDGRH
ncbi:TPA: hypothetical protein G8O11_000564 [Salmonella enterica]|nr:hypothetical protein [Salmonella enterica]